MNAHDEQIFAIAFIILIILLIVTLIVYGKRIFHDKRTKYISNLYQESSGVMDGAAKEAFESIMEIPAAERKAEENAIGALILHNNHIRSDQVAPVAANAMLTQLYVDAIMGYNPDEWQEAIPFQHVLINANEWNNIARADTLDTAITNRIATTQKDRIDLARNVRDAHKGAKSAFVATYLEASKTHTNDPQNTHDTLVVDKIGKIASRLKEQYPDFQRVSADHIVNTIRQRNPDASNVMAEIFKKPRMVDYTLKMTDADAMRLVWARIHDEENAKNRDDLYSAFASEMIDGKGTCATGVAEHAFNTLVAIDPDKRNWDIKTYESVQNQLIDESKIIIKQHCDSIINDPTSSQDRVDAAKQYVTTSMDDIKDVPTDVDDNLKRELSAKIREHVNNNRDLKPYQKERVADYIVAGVINS